MAKNSFKLRSGNTTPFKQMGSSPVKQDEKFYKASWRDRMSMKYKTRGPERKRRSIGENLVKTPIGTVPLGSEDIAGDQQHPMDYAHINIPVDEREAYSEVSLKNLANRIKKRFGKELRELKKKIKK